MEGEDTDPIQFVKEILLSFKKEIDSYLVRLESGHGFRADSDDSVGKAKGDQNALGNKGVGFKELGRKEVGSYGVGSIYKPIGEEGSKPTDNTNHFACSSKVKSSVNSEEEFRLPREEEIDPLCGIVCQRWVQPCVKVKWIVKEGKEEGSSKISVTGSASIND